MKPDHTAAALPLLFVVGDSISLHYGPYLEEYLQGCFRYERKGGESATLRNLDVPQGANGGDSGMVLEYLRAAFANRAFRPDLLLVNCGLHDIKRHPETREIQVPLKQYQENLDALVSLARKSDTTLVWVRTTHCVTGIHNRRTDIGFQRFSEDNAAYNAAADAVIRRHGVPSIDLHGFTRRLGQDEDLFCDHVHYAEPIRRLQAAFLAGWLAAYAPGK